MAWYGLPVTVLKVSLNPNQTTNQPTSFPTLKSALQSVIHKNLSNPTTHDILLKYNDLHNYHYNIIFCWIPSHVGIKGNTKADKLARVTPISSTQGIPIPPSDALPTLRNYIHTIWQATWDSFPNNKLYKIFPKLQHLPPLHHSYSTKEQVILNRLLIGHTHLTHSYLLNKEEPPNCNYCKSLNSRTHPNFMFCIQLY